MKTQANPREVLDKAIRANLGAVHTAAVCEVLAYDTNDGAPKADVRPVHRRRLNTGELVDPPVLNDVPVPPLMWGDFVIHAPLNVGDFVLVTYCERSLDEWLESGGTGVDASDTRRFSELDAVVLRRIDPYASGADAASVQAGALTLSKRDGSVRIVITADGKVVLESDNIFLGSENATKRVALAEDVEAEIQSVRVALAGHTHPYVGLAPAAPGTTSAPLPVIPTTVGPTGAAKVKAE